MRQIESVTGTISGDQLGIIAPHEHFFIDTTLEAEEPKTPDSIALFNEPVGISNMEALQKNPFLVRDNMVLDDLDIAVDELAWFKKAGGTTVVDLTNIGIKRDLGKLKTLSERAGVNIIAGCGLYYGLFLPEFWQQMNETKIAEWMISEIRYGETETGIKPGVIGEIGTSEILYDVERKSLLAAAWTNRETGLPIYIHTYPWCEVSLEAIRILTEEGVRPEQICICHMDVDLQYHYIKRVLDKGVYVMFDNFGKEFDLEKSDAAFSGGPFAKDIERVRMLRRLTKERHADRLMLATDVCLKALLHAYGGQGYDHIFTNIIPQMKDMGIEEKDINTIIYQNPERFLCS